MWRPILVLSNGLLLLLINIFVQKSNAGPTNYSRVDPERTYERKRSYMVTPAVKFVDRWKKKIQVLKARLHCAPRPMNLLLGMVGDRSKGENQIPTGYFRGGGGGKNQHEASPTVATIRGWNDGTFGRDGGGGHGGNDIKPEALKGEKNVLSPSNLSHLEAESFGGWNRKWPFFEQRDSDEEESRDSERCLKRARVLWWIYGVVQVTLAICIMMVMSKIMR